MLETSNLIVPSYSSKPCYHYGESYCATPVVDSPSPRMQPEVDIRTTSHVSQFLHHSGLLTFCYRIHPRIGSPTSAESVTSGYSGSATERTSPGPAPGSPVASVKFGHRVTRSSPLYGSLKKVLESKTSFNFIFSLRFS